MNDLLNSKPKSNQDISEKGQKLKVKNASYPYLYIDYRTKGKSFQYQKGFCAERVQVIREMLGILGAMGFRDNEIKDFLDHWPNKLPPAKRFCVFPQENKELREQLDYLITPIKHHSVRMNFLVMIDRQGVPKPSQGYRPSIKSLKSSEVFELREWGVTFEIK